MCSSGAIRRWSVAIRTTTINSATSATPSTSRACSAPMERSRRNVWKYFAEYVLYWLAQTGCAPGTSTADQAVRGIDGLRADFGQGLPPRAWEYIINKTRTRKWAFVFMAESLDGGPVTYRSNRHFDVLNEQIVFQLAAATTAGNYRAIFEEPAQGVRGGSRTAQQHVARRGQLHGSVRSARAILRQRQHRRRADDLLRPGAWDLGQLVRIQPLRAEFRQAHPSLQEVQFAGAGVGG